MERWLPVVGFEGLYEVSDLGRVRVLDRIVHSVSRRGQPVARRVAGRLIAPGWHKGGYAMIHLYAGGGAKPKTRCAHVLVLESFVGPRPFPGAQGRHLRGVTAGNGLDNLAWGSPSENAADKITHGTHKFGENAPIVKLSEVDVLDIRARPSASLKTLAAEYGVHISNISAIRLRKSWRHIS